MSLCLVNIHGDIEGDYDIITDLPNNATNGDVIKALFPNEKYVECYNNVIVPHTKHFGVTDFDKEWWNAPYKKEGDGE